MLLLFWLKLPFSVDRNLYIIGGQRGEYLNDFFAINVDTLTVNFLTDRVSVGLLHLHLASQQLLKKCPSIRHCVDIAVFDF